MGLENYLNDYSKWELVKADELSGRNKSLVASFYKENPHFKKMIAFRINPALEYEGMIHGFIADIDELGEMAQNPSLWIPLGVMSNAGDFVIKYVPAKAEGSFKP